MSEFEQSAIKMWYNNIECFISPKLKQILTKIKASRARSSKFTITEIESIIKTYVVKHKYVYNKNAKLFNPLMITKVFVLFFHENLYTSSLGLYKKTLRFRILIFNFAFQRQVNLRTVIHDRVPTGQEIFQKTFL